MLIQVKNADKRHLTALDLKRFLDRFSEDELRRIAIKQDNLEFRAAFLQSTEKLTTPTLFLEEY
ncbi:hypothetical protein [Lactiplantibacillus plajomi]|uniref:Uncharacterized protein n=1 Tax=Lactiplantibacillus plajomi TaxID=1457217 RepID=A0ABV6K306_9LACO|nr:hypothetical protein [Lactiplantibacillus plajomi]